MDFLVWLEGLRTPFLDSLFSLITLLGDEPVFTVMVLVLFWCVDKMKGYFLLYVGLLGTIVNQWLKMLCCVPRPWLRRQGFTIVESARAAATGYSFPSGHTQNITVTGLSIACFLRRWGGRIACIAVILLVGLSRMYLGVHTPADVLVSLLAGTALTLGLYPLFQKHGQNPRFFVLMFTALLGFSLLFVLYAKLAPFPANAVTEFSEQGIKQAYTMLGTVAGLLAVYLFERRFVRFDERAVLWAQLLKAALGLALVVAIRSGLKAPLLALTGGHNSAHAIRYFLMFFVGGGLWPMTFRFLPRAARASAGAEG